MSYPSREPLTIPEAIADVCRRFPKRIALQIKQGDTYRQYTYQEVARSADQLSAALRGRGIRPADRIAIVAESGPAWGIMYLGIVAAGGTAVPMDMQLSSQDIAMLLARSGSRMVVLSAGTLPLIKTIPAQLTVITLDSLGQADAISLDELKKEGEGGMQHGPMIHPEHIASLLYTSGTTGEPKGVLLSHRNLISNARALTVSGLAGTDDHFLALLPLHHAYPFMVAFLVPLLLGAQITFLQTLKGPELIRCVHETSITVLIGVPQIFAMMRRAIFEGINRRSAAIRLGVRALLPVFGVVRRWTRLNLGRAVFRAVHHELGPSLRLLASGGARLDPQVGHDLDNLGFALLEGYGLTETAPVVTFNPWSRPKFGSVGVPIPGVEVRIAKPDAHGIGEITVRGPNVMEGYDGDPAATSEALYGGWFHTGDLGYLDREGYLFVTGRIKELIVTAAGNNITPEALEAEYLASSAVGEICLIGTARAREGGEGLHAVVVPNFEYLQTQQISDVRQFIKRELTRIGLTVPPYKRITRLSLVKGPLPRTRLGKIQRYQVPAMLAAEYAPREGETTMLPEADRALMDTAVARAVLAAIRPLVPERAAIGPDDHLDLDLGMDSLRRVELLSALEVQLGQLPETVVQEAITVRDVIEKLEPLVRGEREGRTAVRSWSEILQAPLPPAVRDAVLACPPLWDRTVFVVARSLLKLVFRGVFGLQVQGRTCLPQGGPILLAANHVSYLDPFVVIAALPLDLCRSLHTMGWQAFFKGAMSAWVGRVARVIPVGLGVPIVTVLQAAAAVLRAGRNLLIFPEGERAVDGTLQGFKKGVGILACELEIPVVPVWIEGTFRVLPVGARWPRVHQITVRFGEPVRITTETIRKWQEQDELPHEAASRRIREALLNLASHEA
jgi:long-chain acyl-CoA synthetase